MRKFYFLMILSLATTVGFAQLRAVTFQVDMTGQTVSTDGVHIAGDFQDTAGYGGNWNPDTTIFSQVGTSSIYDLTVNIPDGQWHFKFINGKGWGNVESVPAESQIGNGNDNRWLNVYKDTTLAPVMYAGNAPTGKKLLRLAVDMLQQTSVSPDGVHVAGDFQAAAGFPADWSETSTELFQVDPVTPTVYERIFYTPGDTFSYKFINGMTWTDAESVPSACEVGGNREILATSDTVVPTVCFSMCIACPTAPIPQYSLTLMVDMQNHLACNTIDALDVAGSLNGWAGGDTLTDNGSGVYTLTMMVDSGEVEFKYRALVAGATNWEGVANRIFTLSKDDTAMACFNVDGLGSYCTPIPAASDLTFRVDMAAWGGSIDTAGVYLIGDFTNWQTNGIKMTSLGGGIYETVVTNFCPGQMYFKFVNGTPDPNDESNAEGAGLDSTCAESNGLGGWNRYYERPDADPHTLQFVFDSCTEIFFDIDENETKNELILAPNPLKDYAVIHLSNHGVYQVNVYDMAGKMVKSLQNVNGQVILERGNLVSGIYIITVIDESGAVNRTKFSVE